MEDYEIVYAADDDFASIMGVSLLSLLENNQDLENLRVTIFDSGISDENKEKVEEIFQKYNRKMPRWIKPIDIQQKLSINVKTDRGSLAQYSRLYIQDYFDNNVKRILYLDCDTLIVNSIRKLFEINLGCNIVAGVKDAFSKYYRRNIDLSENDIMINSGVYVVDLDKWRNNRIEDKITEFLIRKKGNVQQGDQGVLNSVLRGKVFSLLPNYNLMSIFYEYSYDEMMKYRKPVNFYSKYEIIEAKRKPIIIHYTSAFNTVRPWFKGATHPKTKEWRKYYGISPWKNIPFEKKPQKGIKKLLFDIYKLLPSGISLWIASIFQVYVRPLKNRLVNR